MRAHSLATGLLACALAFAQTPPTRKQQVDAIFSGLTNDTPGCAVGVAENGTVVLKAGYGMADLERNVIITPASVFESGSVAKQFTAATLMLLARQGKISLDDPMRKYLPELPDYGAPVTIRHVIHHISGLREWRPIAEFGGLPEGTFVYDNTHLLEFASKQKGLNFDPGTNYTYSNTGYNIAAILVERVLGGKTFQAYTREAIFEPLGMRHTRWRDNFRAVIPHRALAYGRTGGVWAQQMPIENIIGAGGLLTTVGDLLLWNENFTHAKVGGPEFVQAQQKPAVLANGRTIAYAAGLMVSTVDGLREVAHAGATGGYRTWLGRYPEKGVSVTVLCNFAQATPAVLGRRTARLWTGVEPRETKPSYSADDAQLRSLTGLYRRVRDNTVARIEWKDGKLQLVRRTGDTPLTPIAPREFAIGATGVNLVCDDSKPVRCRTTGDDVQTYESAGAITPAPAQLAAFAGEYHSQETGGAVKVAVLDGVLNFKVGRLPAVRLEPTFRDAFQTPAGAAIRFWRDTAGRVTALSAGEDRVWDLRFTRIR